VRGAALVLVALFEFAIAACAGTSTGSHPPSTAASSPSASLQAPPTPVDPPPSLPPIIDISEAGAAAIDATPLSDWIVVGGGSVWISGLCDGVGRLDPVSGGVLPCAVIPAGPCGAMEAAFGSIWTATCDVAGAARIDPATSAVTTITLTDPITDPETSVGATDDAIWVVAGAAEQFLVKIDPASNTVTGRHSIPSGARGLRAGFGSIWVTNTIDNTLVRVDPADGSFAATIRVGLQPQFLAVGEGGVWVLNKGEGTVSHVDPATNLVIATISVGPPMTGDIVVGEGSVWVRSGWTGGDTMLIRIDPHTDRVVARYGPGVGSGGVAVNDGVAWISAEDVSTIWRLPLP
jgi:virginiamycin B lyase